MTECVPDLRLSRRRGAYGLDDSICCKCVPPISLSDPRQPATFAPEPVPVHLPRVDVRRARELPAAPPLVRCGLPGGISVHAREAGGLG